MGAYETWRETKKMLDEGRAESRPGAEYLESVLAGLRPTALKDYLEMFADDGRSVDSESIAEFLTGLDELRAPSTVELRRMQDDLKTQAWKVLESMKRLNWTGDHTYADALNDAKQVLGAVFRGEPFPKLERFRCPSRYKGGDLTAEVQCQVQLPHGDPHLWRDDHGFAATWTDEQSINPPKPYAEQIDAVDRCTSEHTFQRGRLKGNTYRCALTAGHEGGHESAGGSNWRNIEQLRAGNPDPINRPLDTPPRCKATNVAGMQCIKPEHSQLVAHVAENGKAW